MAPVSWVEFNCLKAAESLSREGLLFTTKSPGVLGAYLIEFGKIKG